MLEIGIGQLVLPVAPRSVGAAQRDGGLGHRRRPRQGGLARTQASALGKISGTDEGPPQKHGEVNNVLGILVNVIVLTFRHNRKASLA